MAIENPIKLEPVSPINVLAGLKLNGKKPTIAPAKAVIKIIASIGEPFKENIINKDKQEIKHIKAVLDHKNDTIKIEANEKASK